MKKLNIFFLLIATGIMSCEKDASDVSGVVINELMAVNSYTQVDPNVEFDDWIELYNNTSTNVDLSGFYLSDSRSNLSKWKFPEGTSISSHSFLIIWTDSDTLQVGLHANFKLSSAGESVFLVSPNLEIWDKVEYGEQTAELSYARTPNGTGEFKWTTPSFNKSN